MKMSKFKVGDKVKRNTSSNILKMDIVYVVGNYVNDQYFKVSGYTGTFYEGCFNLVTENEEKMEFDIKNVDKKILKQANKEVLEEMDNEVKVKAKAHLKALYQKYDILQEENTKITNELKSILEVISSVVRK